MTHNGRPRRVLAAAAIACGMFLGSARVSAQSAAPSGAPSAQSVLLVQMPFDGDATPDLLQIAEDSTRNALLARGSQGPDRSTVRSALPASTPADTAGLVAFGRSMGATHVLTGRVAPLSGQYNLELHLYDVATSRMATQQRNLGDGEEATVLPQMLAALFAPGAMQPSPEEQARAEAERRAREAQAAQRVRDEADRRAREARARADEAQRRREEAERNRRVYRLDEGGPWSLGGALEIGGRFTPVTLPNGHPPPAGHAGSPLLFAIRVEGLYAALPAYGLEAGATAGLVFAPTSAFAAGATGRFWLPFRAYVPLRAGIGITAGIFQGITGARATTAWLSFDLRGEYDVSANVSLWAAAVIDSVPGLFGSLAGLAGVRVHFGADSTAGASPATGGADATGVGQGTGARTLTDPDAPSVAP